MAGVDIAAAGNVTLSMQTPASSQVRAGSARIVAVKVANLQNAAVSG
jgi:hypothetical protein